MKKLIVLSLIALAFSSSTPPEEIKWYSWEDGLELAKKEKKPMMIFVFATWCHVCKKMNDKTFGTPEVSSIANADFIPVKLDIDKEESYSYNGKKYQGKELIAQLAPGKMIGIPSTIFYFAGKDEKFQEVGYKSPDEFIPLISKYAQMKSE